MSNVIEDRWVDNWARMCLQVQKTHGADEVNKRCEVLSPTEVQQVIDRMKDIAGIPRSKRITL